MADTVDSGSIVVSIVLVIILVVSLIAIYPVLVDTIESQTSEGGSGEESSVTFTTTAHFDGGTKSSSGGNFQVETVTDNLGIVANAFELGSLKGDSFTFADADGDTVKWNIGQQGGACASHTIAGGFYSTSITSDLPSSCLQSGAVTIGGDWDIRIKVSSPVDGDGRQLNLCWYSIALECFFTVTTPSGYAYRIVADDGLSMFRLTAGIAVQVGTTTDLPGAATDPIWLRMTRSTNTFTSLYSTDGSAWTTDESETQAGMPAAAFATFEQINNGLADGTGRFDDFHVATGVISAGGYRTTGTWTSGGQPSPGDSGSVTITYSGASANGFVDYVAILNSADVELIRDDTNRVSGTSATSIFDISIPSGWKVRVGLAGNGAASAMLESIVAETQAAVGGSLASIAAFLLLIPIIVAAAVFIAIVIGLISKRKGLNG